MTSDWGGAQWVLATYLAIMLALMLAVRVAGVNKSSAREWGLKFFNRCVNTATLVAMLWWGGFWA